MSSRRREFVDKVRRAKAAKSSSDEEEKDGEEEEEEHTVCVGGSNAGLKAGRTACVTESAAVSISRREEKGGIFKVRIEIAPRLDFSWNSMIFRHQMSEV